MIGKKLNFKKRKKTRTIPTKVRKPVLDMDRNTLYLCTEDEWRKAWGPIHKKGVLPTKKDHMTVLKRLGAKDSRALGANLVS